MRYRPRVLPTASVDEGVDVVQALGPGTVVLDLEHAFVEQPMTPDAWMFYFRDIHDRLDEAGVQMIVVASARHRAQTEHTVASLAPIIDRGSRPGITASRVAPVAQSPVVALWGEQSVTNAQLAHHLRSPLVRVDSPIDTPQRRTSRRLACALLSHRRAS